MHRLLRNNAWYRFWRRFIRPVVRTAVGLDDLTTGLLSRIIMAIYRFSKYGPHEAAALSYYALFSFFPLVLLAIVLSASILGSAAASNQISDILSFFFPGETASILQDGVTAAADQRGSVSVSALIVLAWSSANLFGNLEKVLSAAFGLQISRRFYQRRIIGLIMIATLIVFLVASLLTNLLFGLLDLLFLNSFNTWLRLASLFVPTAFNAAIFAMLYGFLTPVRLRWDAILPAALAGGFAFEFAKLGFVWYISSLANITFIYGSVATVVAFMLWAFLIFCLIIIGAEICRAINDWMEATSPAPDEDEELQLFIADRFPHYQHVLPPPK